MASLPTLSRQDGSPKSFWERPEGWTGIFTLGGLVVGGFFLAQAVLPAILAVLTGLIAVVGKGIVLGALSVVAFGMFLLVTNPKVHLLIGSIFKLVMRKLTGMVIEIDPIGIMRIYIDDLKKRLGLMDARLEKLSGAIRVITNTIASNDKKYNDAMATAAAAQKAGKSAHFTLNARRAGRAENSNVRYEDVLKKMQFLKAMLLKYREASEVMIADMSDEVESQEVERKAMLAAYGAMTAVRDILQGSGDKREMFDQAMEFAVNDYGMKIGEIEHFMTTSQSFVDGLDLENGSFDEAAMAKIQEWENKADSLLLGNAKQVTLQKLGVQPISVNSGTSYVKLLSK
jgi:hypothetical protein